MSTKTLTITTLAATCALALSACGSSTPEPSEPPTFTPDTPTSTAPAPEPSNSPTPDSNFAELEGKPMHGIIIEEELDGQHRVRAIDPVTYKSVATRTFPPIDRLAEQPFQYHCFYNSCYSPDFTYATRRKMNPVNERLSYNTGFIDTTGTFTDVSAMIPLTDDDRDVNDGYGTFSAAGYFYLQRVYTTRDGNTSMIYRLKPGETTPELVSTVGQEDEKNLYFNLLKGTELSTNKKYVDTHTNDGNLFCWKANETISVDNMCYQLHKEKGLVAFQATTLDNKPRREEDRIGEKVIFKPELQIEETIREYRPFVSPDGSQVVFDLYLKNPTGNDWLPIRSMHIINADGTNDRTPDPTAEQWGAFQVIGWVE